MYSYWEGLRQTYPFLFHFSIFFCFCLKNRIVGAAENDIETIKVELQSLQNKMGEVLEGMEELKGMLKK
jgi:chaperonin cofactor prefoldin